MLFRFQEQKLKQFPTLRAGPGFFQRHCSEVLTETGPIVKYHICKFVRDEYISIEKKALKKEQHVFLLPEKNKKYLAFSSKDTGRHGTTFANIYERFEKLT